MRDLQVLDCIVRPAIASSLGLKDRDVWTNLTLEKLGTTEPEDFLDIAWRLNHIARSYGRVITVTVSELKEGRVTVADILSLVCEKIDALDSSTSKVIAS